MLNPLKFLDRRRKREFYKNQKSLNWQKLSTEFLQMCKNEKANYYANIVHYLKVSNPGKWYSKVKRMSGQNTITQDSSTIAELSGLDSNEEMEVIADHYARVSDQYEPVKDDHFGEYLQEHRNKKTPNVGPYKVFRSLKKMNRNAATVPGDLPMKII